MNPVPGGALLSNGRYRVAVSVAGGGGSMLGAIALTRNAQDATRDADGWFLYVRDLDSQRVWSAGHQPVQAAPAHYEARFGPGLVTLVREDDGIETRSDIWVDAVADVEWRRYTLTNRSDRTRRLDVTSYVEVALNTPAADAGHPAFSKLFLETELLAGGVLLAHRRRRSPEEQPLWLAHALVAEPRGSEPFTHETDRARFIGRGRTLAAPQALAPGACLSGTTGSVLDPILSVRRELALAPGSSQRFDALLVAGAERGLVEQVLRQALDSGPGETARAAWQRPPERTEALEPDLGELFRAAPGIAAAADASEPLGCFNGYGGFNQAGDEYVIRMDRTLQGVRVPPQPWTNVVASETTGFVASERGLGFTWSGNSRERRLTPWFNDPVCDPAGEILYLRDEAEGTFWSATPGPTPGAGPYETRHGFGYSVWRHASLALAQEVVAFVPREDSLKLIRLRVTNAGSTPRRISVFFYAEWVLGGLRSGTEAAILTEAVGDCMIFATRPAATGRNRQTAFAAVAGPRDAGCHLTGDRRAFLGPQGDPARPRGVAIARTLDGRTGAGLDPCAALQLSAELAVGATLEWVVLLGEAADPVAAARLLERYRAPESVARALEQTRDFWRQTLSAVRVATPSPALDLMVNGWLAYQNLSCRMWARSAFYQSGGAFGFRDQLQDAAALLYLRPELTRAQLLLHAAHQFVEGDVLHWWHPPDSHGLRTRFSDDLLWLPYLTQYYLESTGDAAILEEPAPFLTAPGLPSGEDEVLLLPRDSGTNGTLYEHCCRALDRSLTRGAHGLPLIGSGDWNDGMNRVGRLGRGESVWLGFFLHTILERFLPLCTRRGDADRAVRYRSYLNGLTIALDSAGWDGSWYRRAYYDDGTPLGSAESDECRIDALAQAWAVLSGVATPERAASALDAMEHHLVDESAGIIRLLAPPFDRTPHDPGYIKGYLPGVRENGGQYTHAALWAIRALAEAGRPERAAALLEMLNPVRHGDSPAAIARYQVEPYVVAADVYGVAPHLGRGGWTWYTGSAGWMYRVALESILGMTLLLGKTLVIRPCLPSAWPGFTLHYRLPDGSTSYEIVVRRGGERTQVRSGALAARVEDGAVLIPLVQDGAGHRVEIDCGADLAPRYRARRSA
jgi:N,N'-diacetylchitobiose phosphorylase